MSNKPGDIRFFSRLWNGKIILIPDVEAKKGGVLRGGAGDDIAFSIESPLISGNLLSVTISSFAWRR